MRLEVTSYYWTLLTLHFIDLSKFAIPKEGVVFTAIYSFDVHTQSHNDLIVITSQY